VFAIDTALPKRDRIKARDFMRCPPRSSERSKAAPTNQSQNRDLIEQLFSLSNAWALNASDFEWIASAFWLVSGHPGVMI
jgi:hypothetical protein